MAVRIWEPVVEGLFNSSAQLHLEVHGIPVPVRSCQHIIEYTLRSLCCNSNKVESLAGRCLRSNARRGKRRSLSGFCFYS